MKIFKYPLNVVAVQQIAMPPGAEVLSVQVQHGIVVLWALVDDTLPISSNRTIHIIGTGNPIDQARLHFIGTFQLHDGNFVGHVFEAKS